MSRLVWISAAVAGCTIVDETGYLCSDGSRVDYVDMCFASGLAPEDDMAADSDVAGGGPPEDAASAGRSFRYTAREALGSTPTTVFVLGVPGSINDGDEVRVYGPSGDFAAAARGTTFVGAIEAAESDVLGLAINGTEFPEILLDQPLRGPSGLLSVGDDTLDVPAPPGTAGPDGVVYLEVPAAAGGFEGDMLLFNVELGSVLVVAAGIPSVTLPVRQGDTVCAAEDDGASLSLASCATVNLTP
jgi:hypothetical protein